MIRCPLFSTDDSVHIACLAAECAWWDRGSQRCCVALLPEIALAVGPVTAEIGEVAGAIDDLRKKLSR